MIAREASLEDAAAMAAVYNQGIEDRVGTFETRPRTPAEVAGWLDGFHPAVVVEDGGEVIAFAATSAYRARECYQGVAEFSVYVARERRGRGAGRVALDALVQAAEEAGLWKLVSRIFVENTASRRLCQAAGFREVGVYERHGMLEGVWKDCVIVERLLA